LAIFLGNLDLLLVVGYLFLVICSWLAPDKAKAFIPNAQSAFHWAFHYLWFSTVTAVSGTGEFHRASRRSTPRTIALKDKVVTINPE